MIYCEKKDLPFYKGMNAALDQAIDFLMNTDLTTLPKGRNEISGDDTVYANRFDYETRPEDALLYETHKEYADVHVLLSGRERILEARVEAHEERERDDKTDYIGTEGAYDTVCRMTPEKILVVFAGEAHKVKCVWDESCPVQKLVVKVKIGG